MTDTKTQIAAGLERAFASHGFAEPNIETLRASAGVSLRTLYKYMPSRDDMMLAALEHRHQRYMAQVFDDAGAQPLSMTVILDRIADWMRDEASHGCLFHAAVAAAPENPRLRGLLSRHKSELAAAIASHCGLQGRDAEIAVIVEGLMQCWPLLGDRARQAAQNLAAALSEQNTAHSAT